jgi:signal transduction histidine kinase
LKTPIASIRALGDTLARDRVPAARAEYAQMIVRETKRLGRLIDNLLAYSRMTNATEAYVFEDVDVHAVIEDVLQGFSAQFGEKRIGVEVQVPGDLPRVRGDRTALHLMLDNLVDNAIRYSPAEASIIVRMTADSQSWTIGVIDEGIGIPSGEIDRVRRRFHRGSNASPGGSGLGLAIVDRIARDHGGALAIRSAIGSGTTVEAVLPLAVEGP